MKFRIIIFIFSMFLVQSSAKGQRTLIPFRTGDPPVIDGDLSDSVWQKAPYVENFKTWMPDFSLDMTERTHVYYAYDAEHLYFAFVCFDREPDKIKTSITQRDHVRSDDWVCINLDSFNDNQSLYCFYVNPAGIQEDSKSVSGTWHEDKSIDMVWYSGGRIDDKGYTIEIKIPFKSIRYANRNPVDMGVIFERRISRFSESGTYPPLSPDRGFDFFTQTKPIVFEDIRKYTLFEILPAFTAGQRSERIEGVMVDQTRESDISLTAKYGITSELILDGTYNPDFSQVESDAGQIDVNLRYELFYPEKRPFFLEGSESFRFSGSGSGDPLQAILHTRTIVDPIAGAKLSGKITRRDMISAIVALDEFSGTDPGDAEDRYIGIGVFRYKHALHEDSYIGAIYTGRDDEGSYNYVFGLDGQSRLNPSTTLGYYILGSLNRDSPDGKRLGGHAFGYDYSFATREMNVGFGMQSIAPDFNTKMGYLTRSGLFMIRGSVTPKFYPASTIFRRCDLELSGSYIRDTVYDLEETSSLVSLKLTLPNNTSITTRLNLSSEVFNAKLFNTSGVYISARSQVTKRWYINSNVRYGHTIYYSADPYQGHGLRASFGIVYQPSHKLRSDISLTYSDFFRENDAVQLYDYSILRTKLTYQLNRFLFFRGILEYNDYYGELLGDFLASFTYIPGTVIHLGYGNFHEKIRWEHDRYVESRRFLMTKKSIFFKASYLWRL